MSASRRRWFDHLPAVSTVVQCGAQRHTITWRRGKLVLEDHDVLAERSLVALGSDAPLCLDVLDAWQRLRHDVELIDQFLTREGTLDATELMMRQVRYEEARTRLNAALPRQLPPHMVAGLSAAREQTAERERRMWAITLIESLPPEFRQRFALSAIVRCARQWDDPERPHMELDELDSTIRDIAARLLERSVRRFRRNLKPYASVIVDAQVLPPGEQASCTARIDNSGAHVELLLPLAWFTAVWARGIALVDDCFVLSVASEESAEGSALHVIAVRFERTSRDLSGAVQAPAVVTRGDNGAWSLRWL